MDAVECWDSQQNKNEKHWIHIISLGIKRIRIFLNIQYIPANSLTHESSVNDWQLLINHIFTYMPRGYDCWDDFSRNWWAGPVINGRDSEMMKDVFDACKKYKLEPIVCIGASEEMIQGSWLGRVPQVNRYNWLGRFAQEFARYLKLKYKFVRADMEGWNEINELQGLGFGADKYVELMTKMFTGWKSISPNYKTHIFSCNIKEQAYLDYILGNYYSASSPEYPEYAKKINAVLKVTNYVSTHILTDEEWDANYIDAVNWKLCNYPIPKKYFIQQSLLEMSPVSHKDFKTFSSRFNKMIGKVAMYAMVFIFKNEIVHTGDLDEIITYDLQTGNIISIANSPNEPKYNFIKQYNEGVYNMYEDERNYNMPQDLKAFAEALGIPVKNNFNPYLPVLTAFIWDNSSYFHKPEQPLTKNAFDPFVEVFLNFMAILKNIPERIHIWYDENGIYRKDADRTNLMKTNPK